MRVSRAKAQENHDSVIDAASRQFRAHGFDGIGLKDVMNAAGLTPGGFYKRFESKEDLMAQAAARAMGQAAREWQARLDGNADGDADGDADGAMARLVAFYLSTQHRDQRAEGCPLAALGADAARKSPAIRAVFEAGVLAHLALLDGPQGQGAASPSAAAMARLATLVGGLALARMVNDPALSEQILQAAADRVCRDTP